jgi:hypothetical protein
MALLFVLSLVSSDEPGEIGANCLYIGYYLLGRRWEVTNVDISIEHVYTLLPNPKIGVFQ